MFATVWQRYEARQPNSFIVAQLSVYCCLSLRCQDFSFSFFLEFLHQQLRKCILKIVQTKVGKMQSIFRCVVLCCVVFGLLVIGKLCLMLPFVLPQLAAVATSTSANSPHIPSVLHPKLTH